MEYAFKMFHKDLTCTLGKGTFQYRPGEWMEEPEANCVRNGFHAAKNPLDCLSYYPNWKESSCWIVEAAGDIDEDSTDSKISCTRIRPVKEINLVEFVRLACAYAIKHPFEEHSKISRENGITNPNGFVIVRGKNPKAIVSPGTVIGILKEYPESLEIAEAAVFEAPKEDVTGIRKEWTYGIDGLKGILAEGAMET